MKTSNLRLKLKLWKNDKMVKDTDSGKRAVIFHYIRTIKWNKGYLKVAYGNGHYNDTDFYSLEDAKWFLTAFTEKDLVDYLQANP